MAGVTHHHSALDPRTIAEAPELATLALLDALLFMATRVLVAEHPTRRPITSRPGTDMPHVINKKLVVAISCFLSPRQFPRLQPSCQGKPGRIAAEERSEWTAPQGIVRPRTSDSIRRGLHSAFRVSFRSARLLKMNAAVNGRPKS
jgi:hypothetical protein